MFAMHAIILREANHRIDLEKQQAEARHKLGVGDMLYQSTSDQGGTKWGLSCKE